VLLGTVALEPNRWGTLDRSGRPTITLSDWLPAIAAAGFDGLEVWDRHLTAAPPAEVDAVLGGPLAVGVFNSYVSLDDEDDSGRSEVSQWAERARATGVKFNVGNEPGAEAVYAERITRWLATLPAAARLLCECHEGISIAADPTCARTIFEAAGPPSRLQAIVHTHEAADDLRARFDAYGERITHVHVNLLDETLHAPPLRAARARLEATLTLLDELDFTGDYTLEFVHGLLSERDEPGALVEQAADDLAVLRDLLR
jgi:sugar phosphate isomerase/epimerase